VPVREAAEEPGADRPHEEGDREDRPDVEGRVLLAGSEELRLEVDGEDGVDVDVEPLDEIAR
jgi:hypothetical protein